MTNPTPTQKAIELLKRTRELLPNYSQARISTGMYIPPAQQLRNQADQIEADERLIKEIDEFLKPLIEKE